MQMSKKGELKRLVFIPDAHHPYHDKKAWATAIAFIKEFKPHYIICLGDLVDMYSVSDHDKSGGRVRYVKDELDSGREALRDMGNAAPAAQKIYCLGNHEYRFERYMRQYASVFHGITNIEKELEVEKYGWKTIPYMRHYKVGKLYVTHDIGYAGQNAARQTLNVYNGNVVFGHTHQMAYIVEGNMRGERHVAMSPGWLGDFETVEYASQAKIHKFWTHGIGAGVMDSEGNVQLFPLPIIGGDLVVPTSFKLV